MKTERGLVIATILTAWGILLGTAAVRGYHHGGPAVPSPVSGI